MNKIMIFTLSIILLTLSFTSCDLNFSKSDGEIIEKSTSFNGRFYYVEIVYELNNKDNSYQIEKTEVTKEIYESLEIGDKVDVYYNSIKLESFSKKED